MFELLTSMVGNANWAPLLRPQCREMALTTLAYMQMTAAQEQQWSGSANQYVADDDDEQHFTSRVSGELLLEQLQDVRGGIGCRVDCVGAGLEAECRAGSS
jgi:hypothetical protein